MISPGSTAVHLLSYVTYRVQRSKSAKTYMLPYPVQSSHARSMFAFLYRSLLLNSCTEQFAIAVVLRCSTTGYNFRLCNVQTIDVNLDSTCSVAILCYRCSHLHEAHSFMLSFMNTFGFD